MSEDGPASSSDDPRVMEAVKLWKKNLPLTVVQVMLAAGFPRSDATAKNKQMWIRRRMPSKKVLKKTPPSVALLSPGSTVSTLTQQSTAASTTTTEPLHPMPQPNKKRRKTADVQEARVVAKQRAEHKKKAHKRATELYGAEKDKEDGMSAEAVKKAVEADYGWAPHQSTITRYVRDGMAGCSPMKPGEKGAVPNHIFKTLSVAFESFIRINQLNGREADNIQKKLMMKVNCCVGKDGSISMSLTRRLFNETAVDINAANKSGSVEDRRIRWTTYHNLKTWFDNWEKDLLDLGFAVTDANGEVKIPEEQLHRIVNVDETCLSLDGSQGARGGRPEAVFFDPNLPRVGKATSKSAKTTTMITGSTAAGEAIPPHFQFQTAAQSGENMRLKNAMLEFMPNVLGKFGCEEEKEWPCTFGMNEKGGMTDEEFEEYVIESLAKLWPDARDVRGRRVMFKADSGPGRTFCKLLARMRSMGFILYPGVPNSTAVTQETDKNYGPFKSQFRNNLDKVVQARISQHKSTSLQPWVVGLFVFGGTDTVSGVKLTPEESAFEVAFSEEACLKAWAKVGAAPLTRKCLSDKKVRRQLGDADDDKNALMATIQEANNFSVALLKTSGYDGDQLAGRIEHVPKKKARTVANTVERQILLSKASTHGEKFTVTGGSHLTSDDMLKAMEMPIRQKEIAEMEKDKEKRVSMAGLEKEARVILCGRAKGAGTGPGTYIGRELDILLKWYGCKMSSFNNVGDKADEWRKILDEKREPPSYEEWTEEDEARLEELKKMEIDIGDTALGRHQATMKRELLASVSAMSEEELETLQKEIDGRKTSEEEIPAQEAV